MRVLTQYTSFAIFIANCCAGQTHPKINFSVELKWMDDERTVPFEDIFWVEAYEQFMYRPSFGLELTLYAKNEEQHLFGHLEKENFSVDSLRYDSIQIKSNNKSITFYDMPPYLIKDAKWIVVLNNKAPPYCINYVIHHHLNNRENRVVVSHCKCCQDQNYLSISFPAINTIDFDLMDKLNNYLKEKKVRKGLQDFTERSFNYKDNCPYYFKEDFFWK